MQIRLNSDEIDDKRERDRNTKDNERERERERWEKHVKKTHARTMKHTSKRFSININRTFIHKILLKDLSHIHNNFYVLRSTIHK